DPIAGGEVAALPDGLILSTGKTPKGKTSGDLVAYKWADKSKAEKGKLELLKYKGLEKQWTIPDVPGGAAVIVAGNSVIAGGEKRVTVVDRDKKKIVWSAELDGAAYGLAVANGRLYVSTDAGSLYCFDASGEKPGQRTVPPQQAVYGDNRAAMQAAQEILDQG